MAQIKVGGVPDITNADNNKILIVSNGKWSASSVQIVPPIGALPVYSSGSVNSASSDIDRGNYQGFATETYFNDSSLSVSPVISRNKIKNYKGKYGVNPINNKIINTTTYNFIEIGGNDNKHSLKGSLKNSPESTLEHVILPIFSSYYLWFAYPERPTENVKKTLVLVNDKAASVGAYSGIFNSNAVTFANGVSQNIVPTTASSARVVSMEWLGYPYGWYITSVQAINVSSYWYSNKIPWLIPLNSPAQTSTLETSINSVISQMPDGLMRGLADRNVHAEVSPTTSPASGPLFNYTQTPGVSGTGLTMNLAQYEILNGYSYDNETCVLLPYNNIGVVTFSHEIGHVIDFVGQKDGTPISSRPDWILAFAVAGGPGNAGTYSTNILEWTAESITCWIHQDYPTGSTWSHGSVNGLATTRAILDSILPANWHV
jgi:hypothetical protein